MLDPSESTCRRSSYIALTMLLMTALITCTAGAGVTSAAPRDTGSIYALVHQPPGELDPDPGIAVRASYPAFALVEATPRALDGLSAAGVRVRHLPERTQIHLSGRSFDTKDGEPEFSATLRGEPTPGEQTHCLLQFIGPVRNEWIHQVGAEGVEFLDYVPNYAYVVRATPEQMDRIRDRTEVE